MSAHLRVSASPRFAAKSFQADDLARSALHPGSILAWDKGGGKTIAAFLWPLLKRRLEQSSIGNLPSAIFYITTYTALGYNGADQWTPREKDDGSLMVSSKVLDLRKSLLHRTLMELNHGVRRDELHESQSVRISLSPDALEQLGEGIGEVHRGIRCVNIPTLATLCSDVFDCAVVDEAVRLQSTDSYISTGVRTLRPRFRLVGTATPVKNYLDSMFWLAHWACDADNAPRWKDDGAYLTLIVAPGDLHQQFIDEARSKFGVTLRQLNSQQDFYADSDLQQRVLSRLRNPQSEIGNLQSINPRWPYENSDAAKSLFSREFMMTERNISAEQREAKRTGSFRKIEKKIPRICNLHRLWKLLSPVVIRRRKSDMGEDIVPRTVIPIRSRLGTAQRAVYAWHLQNKPKLRKDGEPMAAIAAAMTQLQNLRQAALCPDTDNLGPFLGSGQSQVSSLKSQVSSLKSQVSLFAGKTCSRSWTDHNPKQAAILKIVEQCLSRGEQVVVMSPFQHFSETLHRRLRQARVSVCLLDGRLDQKKRGRLAKAFKRREYSVLIGGIKSMGEGHSFSQCPNLILPSLEWAFDANDQAIDRVHRLDSEKPVNIYVMVGENTIDERLESLFREKGDCASLALDGRLFEEARKDVNLAELLEDAVRNFNPRAGTIDEQDIEAEWRASLCSKLTTAEARFREWWPPIVTEKGSAGVPPASPSISSADLLAALEALDQPALGERNSQSQVSGFESQVSDDALTALLALQSQNPHK